ncbi:cation diffusion facilitator family transporter [Streptomyces avermitilis]|uniref:Cation efflux system protein n=2 Tax=Streptomyces avermitilis TaxID=33903 RepID=Q826Y2_STRAW|nr:cation diffusion facilitator family transporter [Streptomyces avermitilis]KUN53173.1 cation diffusion facilitator family transporter [Streptomyces avermitilis]OOV11642.1 cation diffusion facilitator family transporter [Streptomyces avermitilis]BAC74754.1 putative cation efflux system protein [Streptomyces avermitilis MA-4680 = NBRC 14893]BBJ55357.1 cation efflux system protein [Streptomyces avermitilis]GDY67320.1 cation efflux system protein [Streptomyces avermitilis]
MTDRHQAHSHGPDHGPDRAHTHAHAHPHAHPDAQPHDRSRDHGPDRAPAHDHAHHHRPTTLLPRLRHLLTPHSHETADKLDSALESSARGMRALWVSLAVLGVTAAAQAVVVVLSGSVALLGDTVHNAADALTAVPLGIAFVLGRRAATRRFTYGYGRAEDLAGIAIVLTIAASAVFTAWAAIDRLLEPRPLNHLPVVALAAVIGFAGNEWVARHRIRVGRAIGSAALVADGLHARTDGFTSLAVLVGAGGAALGWPAADPLVGLAITAAIALVLRDAAREVFRRVMDAVDPALVDRAERALEEVPGVRDVGELRLRWIGHRLRAEVAVVVDGEVSVRQAHHIAVEAEHALLHAVPRLTAALVHADPAPLPGETDPHLALAHHTDPSVTAA